MTAHDTPTLAEAREAFTTYLAKTPLAAHAGAILDFVGEGSGQPFTLNQAVDATGGAEIGEVLATLSHLSQGPRPALLSSVVFVDENGGEHKVEGDVLSLGSKATYPHPVTGEVIPDPTSRMHLRFEPVPGLLDEGPSPSR